MKNKIYDEIRQMVNYNKCIRGPKREERLSKVVSELRRYDLPD